MTGKNYIQLYRKGFFLLLRLYPKPFGECFATSMSQTFDDLMNAQKEANKGLLGLVLWVFAETFIGMIKENVMQHKSIARIALITISILMVPLIAMQFTDEVLWGPIDFAVFGIMLISVGFAFEFITAKQNSMVYKAAIGLALLTAFLLIWVNLAVGLIGNTNEIANIMYSGVLAVLILGALVVRVRPLAMVRVMFATALTQGLITIITLLGKMSNHSGSSAGEIIVMNGVFIALFMVSAFLFRRAGNASQV